ncbi:MAG: thioredoxin domain-containing protein, partial [Patescibacteria group bacterium]
SERRELERRENKFNQPSRAGQILRRVILWGGILGGSALLVFGLAYLGSKSSSTNISGTPAPITDSDWVKGNKEAKVTIIEYSDFQCPACASAHPMMKKAVQEFGDKIRFAYRHFPLVQIHQNAELAALASEAAGLQGKFWEMHDMLFEKQSNWGTSKDAKKLFAQYAGELGLDRAKFESDLTSDAVKQKIQASLSEATRIKLGGTPSIFINDKIIDNPGSYDELKKLISDALSENP